MALRRAAHFKRQAWRGKTEGVSMNYMINVDLESANVSRGRNDCRSALHDSLGLHFDLTVHALACQIHGARVVDRPPTRYWDDSSGHGYTLPEVVEQVRALRTLQCVRKTVP
jgi:hypothetical protein